MENLLKRLAHLIHSHYKLIVIIFSLLTIVSVVMILRMQIITDIIDVLPANNKVVIQFKDFIEKFNPLENLTILIEFNEKSLDEQIDIIEAIAKELKESPLIEYADYNALSFKGNLIIRHFPFYLDDKGIAQLKQRLKLSGIEQQIRQNRQRLLSPFSSPLDNELIIRDPLNISSIVKDSLMRTHASKAMDISTGYYLTKDNKMAFIFARPKGKSRDMAFVKKLKIEIDSIIKTVLQERDNPSEISIGLTGTYMMAEEVRGVIQHDIISSSTLSVILIAFLIWLVYRVRALILAFIGFTILTSLAMTLAVAYLMFGDLNIVTSIVTAVLIGLYVDYSIHIINRYTDEFKKDRNSMKAAEIALSKIGPAIIISAITTSLSFFSIIVTQFKGLYELGLISGIGVMLSLLSSLFLLPSLLIWLSNRTPEMAIQQKNISVGIKGIITLIEKRPRQILIFSLVIIIFISVWIFNVRFDNNPEHIGLKDSGSIATQKKIAEKIGKKGEPLIIITKAKDKGELTASFDALEQTFSEWKVKGLIKDYDSISKFLPAPYYQKEVMNKIRDIRKDLRAKDIEKTMAAAMEKNGFIADKDMGSYIKGIINVLSNQDIIGIDELEKTDDPRLKHFYNKESLSFAAFIYPKEKEWDMSTLNMLQQGIPKLSYLLGKPVLFEEIKSTIIWGSVLAIFISLALNLIIVYLHFKRIRIVMFVMLPVILGLLLTIGFMGLIDLPFNFINIGTVALIFGFGVDYGIYIMQAYTREGKDIGNALHITGKNIMMCAATTVAGCGSLITAKFSGIASIGAVLSMGAVFCALASLIFLPAILQMKHSATNSGYLN